MNSPILSSKRKPENTPDDEYFIDLFSNKYIVNDSGVVYEKYIVPDEYAMRMDLISYELYDSLEYVHILCKANRILNPFAVSKGDIINYTTDPSDLESIVQDINIDNEQTDIREQFIDNNKYQRNDPNRARALREGLSLPPTIRTDNTEEISLVNGQILIEQNKTPNRNLNNTPPNNARQIRAGRRRRPTKCELVEAYGSEALNLEGSFDSSSEALEMQVRDERNAKNASEAFSQRRNEGVAQESNNQNQASLETEDFNEGEANDRNFINTESVNFDLDD